MLVAIADCSNVILSFLLLQNILWPAPTSPNTLPVVAIYDEVLLIVVPEYICSRYTCIFSTLQKKLGINYAQKRRECTIFGFTKEKQ